VDQALLLMGLPDRVSASLAIARDGGQADDWAHVVLDFGAARAVLHASMLVAGGAARFTLHGTGGSIVKAGMDPQEAQLRSGMVPGAPGWGQDADPLRYFDGTNDPVHARVPAGDQRRFNAGLRDAIRGTAANPVPPVQALAVMAVIEAAFDSAREGRTVPLALTDAELTGWAASWRED
jgi:predicted dehydrogenase